MVSYLITGANRGIGFGFVQKLSADPTNIVFATTRNESSSTELVELASKLKNIHVLQADITDVASLRAAASDVEKVTGGTLDVLINNAAYLSQERGEYSIDMYEGKEALLDEDFRNFFQVNVLAVIKTINIFLPLLRKASRHSLAKVVTITSAVGDTEFTLKTRFDVTAPYAVSKAAVNMVMAKYAAKFQDEDIIFLAICPGMVSTSSAAPTDERMQEVSQGLFTRFKAAYPDWEGRLLTPLESVTAVLNVVSMLSRKDSGVCLSHNGGTKNWL